MKNETRRALDGWADEIVALKPDVAARVAAYAKWLADDRRLAKADQEFFQAQVDALRRANARKTADPKR